MWGEQQAVQMLVAAGFPHIQVKQYQGRYLQQLLLPDETSALGFNRFLTARYFNHGQVWWFSGD
jgi:hypothetical protein